MLRGEVDAVDVQAPFGGEEPRRSADSTADIENLRACRKVDLVTERASGGAAADVELIDHREVGMGEPIEVLARPLQRVEQRGFQTSMRVMLRNALLEAHGFSPADARGTSCAGSREEETAMANMLKDKVV